MFDYVIIGAGSAGCVLANRLTEDPACRVLLLEAGGEDDSLLIRTPACYGQLQDGPYDWADRTIPQAHLNGRRIFVPQGRVLGGSSAINYMIYIRGNRGDYDQWCRSGNERWAYDDVLPYFVKAENNQAISNRYHGTAGPLVVESHPSSNALVACYLAAAQEIGIPFNPDFNGELQEGCGPLQATLANRARCSAAVAYLHQARSRPNLRVLTHAYATRLHFSGTRAVGVEYFRFGALEKAHAACEVIVSAGAFRSPQLLMLSGIGQILPFSGWVSTLARISRAWARIYRTTSTPGCGAGSRNRSPLPHSPMSSRRPHFGNTKRIEAARSARTPLRQERSSKASRKRRIRDYSYFF